MDVDFVDDVEVVRSERATKPRIDMNIHGMKVVIPQGMKLDPETLIERKRNWIEKKQKKFDELRSRIPERTFEDGEEWPYKGENHLLKLNDFNESRVENQTLKLSRADVEKNGVKDALEDLYREEAREFIESTVREYTEKLGVQYDTLRIKNQKTLWGSCSSKNNLNFNWRMIMAPPDKAEYVIIHELCHLRQPNHSSKFWNLVARYCDRPKQKARWLKEHAVELIFTEDDL
jgi:predicted metal-dependent hydrolase